VFAFAAVRHRHDIVTRLQESRFRAIVRKATSAALDARRAEVETDIRSRKKALGMDQLRIRSVAMNIKELTVGAIPSTSSSTSASPPPPASASNSTVHARTKIRTRQRGNGIGR
jgi:hypothetical protein